MSEIVIRHAVPEDAAAMHRILSQPETYADTLQIPHPSLPLLQERFANVSAGRQRLVACIEGEMVGEMYLEVSDRARRRHTATFGLCVDCNYRGRGVASALMQEMINLCDNWLSVERIELTVFADNERAIRLYQRFGFETEGLAKGFATRNGRKVDALYMARLRATQIDSVGNNPFPAGSGVCTSSG
ncbi:GNAT family N-acetyltransferase [Pantoea sp. CCBC3-3-1]|uniref:GNAT family N-acetyltransferase n=1 Tax=Pantoea sp. CCBC3-3-1 TaxID=2490851 RepID=UPI0011BD56E3|nr:GNAT family N-acetyltransferase [Pantoea sp. CCBC3-3-1]